MYPNVHCNTIYNSQDILGLLCLYHNTSSNSLCAFVSVCLCLQVCMCLSVSAYVSGYVCVDMCVYECLICVCLHYCDSVNMCIACVCVSVTMSTYICLCSYMCICVYLCVSLCVSLSFCLYASVSGEGDVFMWSQGPTAIFLTFSTKFW